MSLHNWMAFLRQSTPLYNVSIPGSHESCSLYDDAIGMTQCQTLSITDQLHSGIRFLDIRPGNTSGWNEFEINHGGHDQFITFAEVQQQVVDFLKNNPSEVVLMNVQQEYYYVANQKFVAMFDQIVAGYEDYWFFEMRIPTIEEARGRIVLIRGYDPSDYDPQNPTNGGWLSSKGIPLNALTQYKGRSQNAFFRTQNFSQSLESTKIYEIEKMIDEGIVDNRIALNFLSYAHGGTATPRRDADAMNPSIYSYVKQHPESLLGTLAMDFATNTPGFIEEIIRHNLKWGEVVAADFSGSGRKEIAVFTQTDNNRSRLSLLAPTDNGDFQLREVWDSGSGNWAATRMSRVLVGDFSGSGKAEIAAFYDYGDWTGLWIFSATGDGSFQPRQVWESAHDGTWHVSRMSEIVVGDFSGTGKAEIAAFYDYGNARTGLWVFSPTGDSSIQPRQVWDSGVGNWRASGMSKVVVGDFSATGKTEIAIFYSYNNQTRLWLLSPSGDGSFQPRQVWDSGVDTGWANDKSRVVVGDFSGTGRSDIAVFYDYTHDRTGLWIFYAADDGSFQRHFVWDSGPGNWRASSMSKVVVGDFSGTGKAEIAVFYSYGNNQTGLWLFPEVNTSYFPPRKVWDSGANNWGGSSMSEIMHGDFSGSGKTEIAIFYEYNLSTTGVWLFSAASSNSFQTRKVWQGELF